VGQDLIVIGRVVKPHGVKGEIKIEYFNPGLHVFSEYEIVYLQDEARDPQPYRVISARPHKRSVVVGLEGVAGRDDAERRKGQWVLVRAEQLPPTEEDEYYCHEIVGMRVFTQQGLYLGVVEDIIATGSNDVYAVRKGEQELLIPAIKPVIIGIDRDANTIIIRPMEGLLDEDDL